MDTDDDEHNKQKDSAKYENSDIRKVLREAAHGWQEDQEKASTENQSTSRLIRMLEDIMKPNMRQMDPSKLDSRLS